MAPDETNGLKGAAYHESGHAVVGHVLKGRPFTLITIEPNDVCDARVEYEPMPDWFQPEIDNGPETEALIRTEVVNFFAGSFAQERIDGPEEAEGSSYGDFLKASNLAGYVCGSTGELEAYLKECEEESGRLVGDHWPAIEALAAVLLEKGTLTGDEARSVVKLAEELEGS